MTFASFLAVFCFAVVSAQVLQTCPSGVGLATWWSSIDSRGDGQQIRCADGSSWSQRGIRNPTATDTLYTVTLRSLGKGIRRQGFVLTLRFEEAIQLVGACIADKAPIDQSSWGGLKPGNNCRGHQWSSRLGSPRFVQSLDESGFQLKGWQVKNPPRPTGLLLQVGLFAQGAPGQGGLVACNFHFGLMSHAEFDWVENEGDSLWYNYGNSRKPYNVMTSGTFEGNSEFLGPSALVGEESGLASYMGMGGYAYEDENDFADFTDDGNALISNSRACWTSADNRPLGGPILLPSTQSYGSLDAVVQSFMGKTFRSLWNADEPLAIVNQPQWDSYETQQPAAGSPTVMYANYAKQQTGQLGFQLGCDPSEVDETKFVYLTFWGGKTISDPLAKDYEYFCYPSFQTYGGTRYNQQGDALIDSYASLTNWDGNAGCVTPFNVPYDPNIAYVGAAPPGLDSNAGIEANLLFPSGMPRGAITEIALRVTCQNVETTTPTPKWAVTEPIPTRPFAQNSYTLIVQQCERRCQDPEFQANLVKQVELFALTDGNAGAKVFVECYESPVCTETLDTVTLSRRGLQQAVVFATSIPYLMKVLIVTRSLATANFVMSAIRAGTLNQFGLSPFASISLVFTNPAGKQTSLTAIPTAAAKNIAVWPNVGLAEWTGRCYVYGPCRVGICDSGCNNGQIVKNSDYSGADIYCLCSACAWAKKEPRTQYLFYSDQCAKSLTVADATTCCKNVQQDVVCWLSEQPEFAPSDAATLGEGMWAYRAPNIGSAVPNVLGYDGPTSCPTSSSSSKGLLGLLGLLGLIPLCCCLLALLLCCIRRKKREGDVHFATFDAAASCPAPLGVPSACAPPPSFAPVSYQ